MQGFATAFSIDFDCVRAGQATDSVNHANLLIGQHADKGFVEPLLDIGYPGGQRFDIDATIGGEAHRLTGIDSGELVAGCDHRFGGNAIP
jgi:hypothetical protein